jgi:hypothetical protein
LFIIREVFVLTAKFYQNRIRVHQAKYLRIQFFYHKFGVRLVALKRGENSIAFSKIILSALLITVYNKLLFGYFNEVSLPFFDFQLPNNLGLDSFFSQADISITIPDNAIRSKAYFFIALR